MSPSAKSVKDRVKNIAKKKGLPAQIVLQNYVFERFLERISKSEYQDKFILKGGVLISSLIGIETRTTMDMDTTLRAMKLDEENLSHAIAQICSTEIDDNFKFQLLKLRETRLEGEYGGFKVSLEATCDRMKVPVSMDVTAGDVITPGAVRHNMKDMFNEEQQFQLWAYNTETVLAEKVVAILNLNVTSTRPRDYYDVYMLTKLQSFDLNVFHKAFESTSKQRGLWEGIKNQKEILIKVENSDDLKNHWRRYQKEFSYAAGISFEDTIKALKGILSGNKQAHVIHPITQREG